MIIFWLSQSSNVTPPVCLAAFAAAGIADASPLHTALHACRMAVALYVIPLLFAYTTIISGDWGERLWSSLAGVIGLLTLAAALAGHGLKPLRLWQRACLLFLTAALLHPSRTTTIVALVGLVPLGIVFTRFPRATRPSAGL